MNSVDAGVWALQASGRNQLTIFEFATYYPSSLLSYLLQFITQYTRYVFFQRNHIL